MSTRMICADASLMAGAVKPTLAPARPNPLPHYQHNERMDEVLRQQLEELIDSMDDSSHLGPCCCLMCKKYDRICGLLFVIFG